MTRQEHLQETYEDARFALLMNHVAEVHGKQALEENRALREDPDAEVPQDVHRACLKAIKRAFRKKNAQAARYITVRILKTVALVALLGILILSIVFAVSSKFKACILNMLVDTFHNGVSSQVAPTPPDWANLEDIKPAWVPEKYELTDEGSFAYNSWATYSTAQGDQLYIDLTTHNSFDSENAETEEITLYGFPAYIIDQSDAIGDSHGIIKVIVVNEHLGYILSVISAPHSATAPILIKKDELIQITESIFE